LAGGSLIAPCPPLRFIFPDGTNINQPRKGHNRGFGMEQKKRAVYTKQQQANKKQLAEEYGVCDSAICQAINRNFITWDEIAKKYIVLKPFGIKKYEDGSMPTHQYLSLLLQENSHYKKTKADAEEYKKLYIESDTLREKLQDENKSLKSENSELKEKHKKAHKKSKEKDNAYENELKEIDKCKFELKEKNKIIAELEAENKELKKQLDDKTPAKGKQKEAEASNTHYNNAVLE
jgi:DNA repair exonuclease SbcCD ATPase subunit